MTGVSAMPLTMTPSRWNTLPLPTADPISVTAAARHHDTPPLPVFRLKFLFAHCLILPSDQRWPKREALKLRWGCRHSL